MSYVIVVLMCAVGGNVTAFIFFENIFSMYYIHGDNPKVRGQYKKFSH
jgi:hypothetical protein